MRGAYMVDPVFCPKVNEITPAVFITGFVHVYPEDATQLVPSSDAPLNTPSANSAAKTTAMMSMAHHNNINMLHLPQAGVRTHRAHASVGKTIKKEKKKKRLRDYVVFIVSVANFEYWFGVPPETVEYARYSDPLNAVPSGAGEPVEPIGAPVVE